MKHTLTTAARVTGVSRSTIHRAVKSGKVSAIKNEEGEYRIDPAELHRVYPAIPEHPKEVGLKQSETRSDTDDGMASKLLDLVTEQKDELATARTKQNALAKELKETQERLQAHREAATLLVDPKTFEAKKREWEAALVERQREIQNARAEAEAMKQQQIELDVKLKSETERVRALESRGLIARLLNKPITENG